MLRERDPHATGGRRHPGSGLPPSGLPAVPLPRRGSREKSRLGGRSVRRPPPSSWRRRAGPRVIVFGVRVEACRVVRPARRVSVAPGRGALGPAPSRRACHSGRATRDPGGHKEVRRSKPGTGECAPQFPVWPHRGLRGLGEGRPDFLCFHRHLAPGLRRHSHLGGRRPHPRKATRQRTRGRDVSAGWAWGACGGARQRRPGSGARGHAGPAAPQPRAQAPLCVSRTSGLLLALLKSRVSKLRETRRKLQGASRSV